MSPATLTAFLAVGVEIFKAIEKGMDDENLPVGDPEFDQALKAFHEYQRHLGQRFETAMLAMDETES